MGKAMGGEASAPNPGWYFRASVAACCSTAIAMNAARRGINLTALEVTVEAEGDNRGILGMDENVSAGHAALRTNVKIAADNATPEQLQDLVRFSESHSPVGCTVRDAPPNTLRIDVVCGRHRLAGKAAALIGSARKIRAGRDGTGGTGGAAA